MSHSVHLYDKDWRHGAAYFDAKGVEYRIEWSLFRFRHTLGFSFRRDVEGLHLSLGFPGMQLFPSVIGRRVWRATDATAGRECDIEWHDGKFWFKPWGRCYEWRSIDPWWVRGITFDPMDFVFGANNYNNVELERRPVLIPMPERSYPGEATKRRATWKRPRAWWKRERVSWWIDIPGGVPCPGKSGEDGIFGTGADGHKVEDAIGRVVAATLKMRERHGHGHIDTGRRDSIHADE